MRYKYSLIPPRVMSLSLVVLFSIFVVGCGSLGTPSSSTGSLSGGWLHSSTSDVEFLQLTVSGSQVSGQEQEEYETQDNPPQLQQKSSGVSGIFNGTQVTLSFTIYGFPVNTYAGTYGGTTLTLTVPDQSGSLQSIMYQPASIDDYNNTVQQLQQSVNQQVQTYDSAVATATETAYQQQIAAATASAISNEQQNLASNISGIGGVISQLDSDADFNNTLQGYSNDIKRMQADYQTVQNDAAGGCSNASQVAADVSQVAADNSQIAADDSGLAARVNGVQSELSNLQDWVNTIQQQWNDLGQQAFSGVSANDVSNALQNGNTAINQATSAMKSAQSQASGFDAQANQINQQAQTVYNNMHC